MKLKKAKVQKTRTKTEENDNNIPYTIYYIIY